MTIIQNSQQNPYENLLKAFISCSDERIYQSIYDLQDTIGFEESVIHKLTRENRTQFLKMVLDKMVDPNQRDIHGRTPLFRAAWIGNVEAMNLLIAAGADVNIPDFHNRTPLFMAASRGQALAARILLQKGASTRPVDEITHRTAFEMAHYLANVSEDFSRTAKELEREDFRQFYDSLRPERASLAPASSPTNSASPIPASSVDIAIAQTNTIPSPTPPVVNRESTVLSPLPAPKKTVETIDDIRVPYYTLEEIFR